MLKHKLFWKNPHHDVINENPNPPAKLGRIE
jgi:hypothetical protein